MKYPESEKIKDILDHAQKVVVLQADNPDGDSLASALALEHILGDMGKEPHLYCGIDMPSYLHYLKGWDRVNKDLPDQFDATIVVDTSSDSLFESLRKSGEQQRVVKKPSIVIDHHGTEPTIEATVVCNQVAVSTGEVIYELAQQLDWKLNPDALDMLAVSIMSDSLGLVSEGTTARSIQIISEIVEKGVSLAKIDSERRQLMRKSEELIRYKGRLLGRIEYHDNVATIDIPWEEIETYSPSYNPPMLVMDEMRMTEGVDIAIAFKTYNDGKITGKIRCNYGKGIASKLAEIFGGGGHKYASGFKITDGRPFNEVKSECIKVAIELLNNLDEKTDETT